MSLVGEEPNAISPLLRSFLYNSADLRIRDEVDAHSVLEVVVDRVTDQRRSR